MSELCSACHDIQIIYMDLEYLRKEIKKMGMTVTVPRRDGGYTIYDLSPAFDETAVRNKLTELGWTPPND